MPTLPVVLRITHAGTPPVALREHEIVEDVEALCRGVVRNVLLSNEPSPDDIEQTFAELLERVVVLTHSYDPSRAGILFRPWLYRELTFDAIDYWRRWAGRKGQKRVADERPRDAGARDSGLDDGAPRVDRLDGSAAASSSDRPEDRPIALGRLYARGDRATLREERRLGLNAGPGAASGDPRAGARASERDAGGTGGSAAQPHWLDCVGCGWRNYRTASPNGVAEWHFPEHCLACGDPLVVAAAEGLLRVA